MSAAPKKSDVVSRLTDASRYTGAHKARFDAEGKGKGIAGRRDIVDFKGNTNTSVIEKTTPLVEKKPVVTAPLGKEKFGTQASKAAAIKLYRNGDKHHTGETLTLNLKLIKTMDQVLDKASTLVKLPTGAVRKIYKKNLKTTIKSLEDFEDGGVYLCCGGEKPATMDKLPAVFHKSDAAPSA